MDPFFKTKMQSLHIEYILRLQTLLMDPLKKMFSWLNCQPPPQKPQHCRLWPPKLPRTKGTWSNKQSDGVAKGIGCKYSSLEDESSNGLPHLVQRSKNAVLTMLPVYKMTWSESNNGLYIVHFSNIFILCFFFLKYVFSIVLCYRSDFFCMLYMLWYTIVVVNSLYTFSPPLFLQYSIVYKTLSWYFDALNFIYFLVFPKVGWIWVTFMLFPTTTSLFKEF